MSTVRASTSVGDIGDYTWGSTSQMVADVQTWLDSPATNFGWLLRANETRNKTSERFDSKENGTVANRPVLTVTFIPP